MEYIDDIRMDLAPPITLAGTASSTAPCNATTQIWKAIRNKLSVEIHVTTHNHTKICKFQYYAESMVNDYLQDLLGMTEHGPISFDMLHITHKRCST